MTVNKELRDILSGYHDRIKSKICENKLDEAIYLVDSLCATFKSPSSPYDRSSCTPYSNEVSEKYGIGEYINASFVPALGTLFIAAQNPKDEKKDVFIDLLVKSNTSLIVSLINDPKYFEEEWLKDRKIIKYMGKDLFIDETYDVQGRDIRRLRYINWVDFSVITREEMEQFHSHFNKVRTDTVVVHCIAGVGRTGTFIMYDILKKMENVTLDMFVDVFLNLRSKRAHLVTNKVQLEFLKSIFLGN
ncbi:protein tyrosine phosphatase [Encephalitozoon intestinalis ATCC 50506]|uniref:Protein tyrosine phosphatase n=1 Tax=Encephalitozoon intestinalis (strain ATCC 50506) TaxID=876142 RepID=E0S6I0_ENCIT|nr:protein tyrosine phosphatase [Encephalitozoon intestinalis ATCC 50506]ADM11315.1 protein tyrosine phosphatase [Encephalitozoon intestinalis ATCC 50506]UTX45001.1 protein tyrosine phosphatase [Encephalitozoon intestinalis]